MTWISNLFSAALFVVFMSVATACAKQPNVLFLAVDDMNDWIGSLGATPRAITPNLDKLAARVVNFSNAHTPGVYCAPARAAIFSGQYASTTGYRDQLEGETERDYGLRVANELESKIAEMGAENVIGFIAEPVVGATSGALVPVPGYFKRIREICDWHNILSISNFRDLNSSL